ncbi:MAG TPA: hypothetical protein VIV60_01935 [Polyangiaceae bacterium]
MALWLSVATPLLLCHCTRKSETTRATEGPATSSSAIAFSVAGRAALGCKDDRGTTFSFGPIESASREDVDSDADAGVEVPEDLPFGVTIGAAHADAERFVVSAIDARSDGSHSVLVVLDPEVSRGHVIDLGRVYGDAEPPQAVFSGDDAFVVVPDSDAGGNMYRYGWVRSLGNGGRAEWSGSFEIHPDDSAVVALAIADGRIVVAWDEVDRKTRVSQVRWMTLVGVDAPKLVSRPKQDAGKANNKANQRFQSTAIDIDAEMPRLVAQHSGFWLAYLASDAQSRPSIAKPLSNNKSNPDESLRPVDLGHRGIVLIALDAHGTPKSQPIRVTEPTAHVLTFEVEALPDGGAIIAYRDSDVAPGTEERIIELVRVRPDGGIERRRIDDERVGVGAPLLLVDEHASAEVSATTGVWLAVAGSAGETRIADLSNLGAPVVGLVDAKDLASVEPLARYGEAVLVARRRARSVEFERLNCRLATPSGAK